MPLKSLNVESEPYSRYGSIAADGIKKLLGAPHLDQLQTVIREAVQNSWDAGKDLDGLIRFTANIRLLTQEEREALGTIVFGEMPFDAAIDNEHPLSEIMNGDEITVLELSDFGTTGLGGPTRPNEVPEDEQGPDFVDFMRNVGSPRDTEHGGGTYGYGKSSFYRFSGCQSVVVYTHTSYNNSHTQRLMACRLGRRFDIESGDNSGRYTGRHWWGENIDGFVDPVSGNDAKAIARSLGMPERRDEEYGTTIMVLAPLLGDKSLDQIGQKISESFLCHFWPKMVPEEESIDTPMKFEVTVSGRKITVPSPEDSPPFKLFAKSLRKVRLKDESVDLIQSQKPRKDLGYLHIQKGIRNTRLEEHAHEGSLIPDLSHHVALMRPAELVVKYLEGEKLYQEGAEWAGVFICSDEEEVEKAFAESEPPAHDDWDPQYLSSGSPQKTYVNVALKNIKKSMGVINAGVPPPPPTEDEDISVAEFADAMGGLLGFGSAPGPGPKPPGPEPSNNPVSISTPEFIRHEIIEGNTCAVFRMQVRTREPSNVEINGSGRILRDGGGADRSDAYGTCAELIGWKQNDESMIASSSLELEVRTPIDLEAYVTIPDGKAVTFKATAEVSS